MKYQFACFLTLVTLSMTSLYAGGVPITGAQLGYESNVVATVSGPDAYLICPADVNGCGGAFSEQIGPINATIWCVDSQLDVTNGETYNAYVESLNAPVAAFDDVIDDYVRYGAINTVGGAGGWSYSLSGYGVANPNSAQTRYELAAILISQYIPNDGMPSNSAQNQSIQDAIWHLTENSVTGNLTDAINVGVPVGYSDWIAYAASLLPTEPNSFFSQWAVVSGGYNNATGQLLTGPGAVQTFLVQVTPEPRFYGVLLVGLLSLCGIIYRRRVAS
jgi:hypothetical protein